MSTSQIDQELHTQVMKREAVKEKAYREQRIKYEEEFHSNIGLGGSDMTKQELRKIIDGDRRMYYRTEELNDKLYIHYKGWRELKNLDGWTGLKTLYAECNAFSRITGLQNCTKLRSIFLQDNCINKISGLEACTDLWTINLSGNFVERIEGLEHCKGLNTLIIAKNKVGFGGVADLEPLVNSNLCSLDIQDNRIEDPDVVPEVFARMPSLRVLYLKGNGCAKKIVNYRKSLTVYCKDLRYLDDRPVFEDDRRAAEAFNRGGIEMQREEQRLMKKEKSEKHERNMRAFQEMIEDARQAKKERDAMRLEDKYTDETDPVESFERRAKRLNDAWKEEEKENLKDDAKEHALKCMEQEKETVRRAKERGEKVEDAFQANEASRDTQAATDLDAEDVPVIEEAEDLDTSESKSEKKVDDRKLVYDDIWDDAPCPWTQRLPEPADAAFLASLGAPSSQGSAPSQPQKPRAKETLAERSEPNNAAEESKSEESKDSKPSWHSKYLEQVAKTQGKIEAARTAQKPMAFAPPPRREVSAAAAGWMVNDDSRSPEPSRAAAAAPAAAAASPQEGAGELDEMD